MPPKRKYREGGKALELADQAFRLARSAPGALALYYIGSLPFTLALLYFFAEMSHGAFAYRDQAGGALALTILFVWMKTWQTLYARALWAAASGTPGPRWSAAAAVRVAGRQAVIQPWGLFVLPLSLLAVAPYGHAYAFFQNATVMDDGEDVSLRKFISRIAGMAKLWPGQNFKLIWALSPSLIVAAAVIFLVVMPVMEAVSPDWTEVIIVMYSVLFIIVLMPLSPFGVTVAVNIAVVLLAVPALLKTLVGVESVYASNPEAMLGSVFFAVVCALSYLCLDPLVKAGYVLRCFHGRSLTTGDDLRTRLRASSKKARSVIAAMLIGGLALSFSSAAFAEPPAKASDVDAPSVSGERLDRALDRELEDRVYTWRMPRPPRPEEEDGFFASVMTSIGDTMKRGAKAVLGWIRGALKWLKGLIPDFNPPAPSGGSLNFAPFLQAILYILLAALLSVAGVFLYRVISGLRRGVGGVVAEEVDEPPDLEDESTTADELPEEGWLQAARQLASQGDYRLALRAAFLAILANLGERGLVNIKRFKTNLDYQRELGRHSHELPRAFEAFGKSVAIFESVWYGLHQADVRLLEEVIDCRELMGGPDEE